MVVEEMKEMAVNGSRVREWDGTRGTVLKYKGRRGKRGSDVVLDGKLFGDYDDAFKSFDGDPV
jgi:hypothetical protein